MVSRTRSNVQGMEIDSMTSTVPTITVGKTAIIIEHTRKRDTRAVIPILPEAHKLLDRIGRKDNGPVLLNSRGSAWTESGLGSVFQKSKPKGFDRRIHDLRGTFATRLILAGATDQQAADVLGWGAKEIATIRRRYVDSERVVIELAEMMSRRAPA
ncbi:MAG: tyrosine-type recombinase/integrase [Croceibacterium sp.]